MRKLILTLFMLLAIAGLSLTSTTPAAHCEDCNEVRWTCGQASASIYNACISGGGSTENCALDEKTWWTMCVRANGCSPNND